MTTTRTLLWTAALLASAAQSFAQVPDAPTKGMPLPQTSTAVPAALPVAAPATPPMPVPPAVVFRAADEGTGNSAARSADSPAPRAAKNSSEASARKKAVTHQATRKQATDKKATKRKATNKKVTRKKAPRDDANQAPKPKPAAVEKKAG